MNYNNNPASLNLMPKNKTLLYYYKIKIIKTIISLTTIFRRNKTRLLLVAVLLKSSNISNYCNS
jgi:hypothetical protein